MAGIWQRPAAVRLVICAALIAGVAVAARAGDVAPWVADVDVLMTRLEATHPDMYTRHTPAEWAQAADSLKALLETAEFDQGVLGMMRLVAMLNDGHSKVLPPNSTVFTRKFPIIMRMFSDGVYVRTALPEAAELFGKRIVAIEGVPIDEAMARVRPYVSCDNEMGFIDKAPLLLRLPSVLHVIGLTPELVREARFTVEDESGARTDHVVEAMQRDLWTDVLERRAEWVDADTYLDSDGEKPLYRRAQRNYSFEYLEDHNTLYVNFQSVRNEADESFKDFCARLFAFVDAHAVDRFILDIRENKGGNNYLNQPMVHGLIANAKLQDRGKVFVIIGRDTFSAAMSLAVDIERNTHAIFVGEPTGARPNHFGDTTEFVLPKSGLRIRCSTLYWQNSDPRDQRPWIAPELPVAISFADFVEHRDPALEAILSYDVPPTGAGDDAPNTRWLRQRD